MVNPTLAALIFLVTVTQGATLCFVVGDHFRHRVRLVLRYLGVWQATAMLILSLAWGHVVTTAAAMVAWAFWVALLHRQRDRERSLADDVEHALHEGRLHRRQRGER